MIKKNLCEICNKKFSLFLNYGKMPIANNYDIKLKNFKYDCQIAVCLKDRFFKNINNINEKILFNNKYPYNSSVSVNFSNYLLDTANELHKKFLSKNYMKNTLVLEIGSSDGVFLNEFKKRKINHIGLEPTKNNHLIAKKRGVNSINKFLSVKTAKWIIANYGKSDLVYSINVIAHINNINSTFKSISMLLKSDGYFIFENIYLFDLISNNSFDQLYDEHVYTLSATTVNNLCKQYGMKLFKIKRNRIQGGSIRYYISKNSSIKKEKSTVKLLKKENQGLLNKKVVSQFYERNIKLKYKLKTLLNRIKNEGKTVVGIGASAKSTFLINFCEFNSSDIKLIYDTSPDKINYSVPGTNIKIKNQKEFLDENFDYVIVFAWNHFDEIYKKYAKVSKKRKFRWIIPNKNIKII